MKVEREGRGGKGFDGEDGICSKRYLLVPVRKGFSLVVYFLGVLILSPFAAL